MKLMCMILSFAILLTGCYSQQATRVVLDDRDVVFTLNDGSYIKAEAGAHHRAAGGYDVKGFFVGEDSTQVFVGIVRNSQITGITVSEFDTGLTALVIGAAIVACVIIAKPDVGLGPLFR
jgi:hypothetical protein